ncbi:excisionase family DNA-binding protein [Rhodovulum sulfidophilum]|uniref:excisionase family DNA-binding protein n=1 Tax=Rhodovulum sulfidophilum TaxID=35806 RepID=UPI003B215010
MAEPQRPYTPDMLAERWGCSGETVRAMIRDGRLPAFRVGGRLLRVSAQTVKDFECGTIESAASRADMSSSGPTTRANADAIVLRRTRPGRPSGKRATSS